MVMGVASEHCTKILLQLDQLCIVLEHGILLFSEVILVGTDEGMGML